MMDRATLLVPLLFALVLGACSDEKEPAPPEASRAELARMLNRARLEAWLDDEGRTEARRLLESYLEQQPGDGEVLLELARVIIASPETEAALPIVKRARAALAPDRDFERASCDYVEGLVHKKAERWAEACAPLLAARTAQPEIAQVLYQGAWALEHADRAAEARALYEELLARKELVRPASFRLMTLARKAGDEDAEVAARALFEAQDPDEKPELEFCELLRVNRRRQDLPADPEGASPLRFSESEGDITQLVPERQLLDNRPSPAERRGGSGSTLTDGVFLDFDHDGDLDAVALDGDGSLVVLVSDGQGRIERRVLAAAARLGWKARSEGPGRTRRIAFDDLDGDNDVDLVVATDTGIVVASNRRLDGFAAKTVVAEGDWVGLAIDDIDGDGHPDLVATSARGVVLFRGTGREHDFASARPMDGVAATLAPLLHDVDDDGDVDVLVADGAKLLLARNRRAEGFVVEEVSVSGEGDGAFSALVWNGGLVLAARDASPTGARARAYGAKPDASSESRALTIQLEGRRDNEAGIGAVIELDAGELQVTRMKKESGPIRIGYGRHELDGLAIRWPNGIRQSIMAEDIPADGVIAIKQKQGLVASCPFLYTKSKEGWRFLTDVVGIAPLDEWLPPGAAPFLDPHEFVRIPGEALAVIDGRATISITEELRETTYLDGIELLFVDHDPDDLLLLDESTRAGLREDLVLLRIPSGSERPVGLRRPSGEALGDEVARRDGRFADNGAPPRSQWAGYIEDGDLLIDVPEGAGALLFEGRVAWYDSTVAYALHQAALGFAFLPRLRDLRDDARIELGLFRGMDRGLVVDLPEGARELRLESRHALLFDRIVALPRPERLDFGPAEAGTREGGLLLQRAELASARLFERGYSAITGDVATHRQGYDYDRIERDMGFPRPKGRATATGDVRDLIATADDGLAILLPGDAIEIDFAAPPVPEGKRRTYILRVIGWAKEAGFHNRSGMAIDPLPFHAMSAYPPPPGERPAKASPRERRSR